MSRKKYLAQEGPGFEASLGLDRRYRRFLFCQTMDSQVFLNFCRFHSQATDTLAGFVRTYIYLAGDESSEYVRLKIILPETATLRS